MTAKKDETEHNRETYAIVGELVLISSALDTLLNQVMIEVLELGSSLMVMPVVASLDPARKIEILKARAAHFPKGDWKEGVNSFVKKVETVFKHRNIACHTPPKLEAGKWTLKPIAAAKLMKKLNIKEKGSILFPSAICGRLSPLPKLH